VRKKQNYSHGNKGERCDMLTFFDPLDVARKDTGSKTDAHSRKQAVVGGLFFDILPGRINQVLGSQMRGGSESNDNDDKL
jgi:hypothetical protein